MIIVAGACGVAAGTPLAILAGIGSAARRGIIVKGGLHLEKLADIDTIVFDKTGSLNNCIAGERLGVLVTIQQMAVARKWPMHARAREPNHCTCPRSGGLHVVLHSVLPSRDGRRKNFPAPMTA